MTGGRRRAAVYGHPCRFALFKRHQELVHLISWVDLAPPGSRHLLLHETGAVLLRQPVVFPADCGMQSGGHDRFGGDAGTHFNILANIP